MRRALALLALLVVGCGHGSDHATNGAPRPVPAPPLDPWLLTTLDGTGGEPAYLSNGLIGVRIGRNGGGLGPDGKPLGFFMIDEYDPSGEEKIRPMPNPLLVTWALGVEPYKEGVDPTKTGGTPLDPRGGTDYRQTLDMRTGVLTTSWNQEGAAIRCDTVLHPTERALGQHWTIKVAKDTTYAVRTLDYGGPNDAQQAVAGDQDAGIAITASPRRVVTYGWHVEGGTGNALYADKGFRVQDGSLKAGQTVTFERTLSFGKPSTKPLPLDPSQASGMVLEKTTPRPWGYEQIANAAAAAWKKRWTSDVEIDGPVEDQQAVRSFLFYLRSSIAPGSRRAVSPFALSSDLYNGHVFWDADIWVFPALALTDPDLAKEIGAYRLDRIQSAIDDERTWESAGRPTGGPPLGPVIEDPESKRIYGAKFPWESSISGRETAPGPFRSEDHITGSVLWSLSQAEALGNGSASAGTSASGGYKTPDVSEHAAAYYRLRSEKGSNGLEIKGVISPDESHTGDNDLYTNLLAMWLTSGRKWPVTPTYKLPHDAKSFLTYDNDPVMGYKQAAAVLACYPLQYPPAEAQTKTMLERFGPKTIANGPAMTDSIEGLLWARVGQPEKGYDEWRKGWVDFTRHPLMMFSEKRKSPRTYFATGAGGALQTVLYGFAGLRIDDRKAPGALWSHPLRDGKTLSVSPHLPTGWKAVRLKGLALPDGRYDLDITSSAVKGRRLSPTKVTEASASVKTPVGRRHHFGNLARTMTRLAPLAFAALLLAGCGKSSGGDETAAPVVLKGPATGKVEVQAFKGGYGIDFYQKAAQEYGKAHPGVQITVDGDPHIWEKLQPRFVAGDPPDLAFPGWKMDHWALAEEDQLAPLDTALDGPPDDGTGKDGMGKWRDTFEPALLKLGQMEGKQYVLPYYFNVMGWWYDPGVFKAHGWTAPKNYDELLALCPKIKAAGLAPITYQGKYPYYMIEGMLMPWTLSVGGEKAVKDLQNLEPGAWKSPALLKAVSMIAELNEKGFFEDGATGLSHTQSQQDFVDGKAAMIPCGTWLSAEMKSTMPKSASMEFFLPPVVAGGTGDPSAILIGIEPWMIPSKAKNPSGGIALYRYMTSLPVAKRFVQEKGTLMAIKGSDETQLPPELKTPNAMFKASKTVWADQFRAWYPAMETDIEGALTSLLNKQLTPQAFCDRAEADAEKTRKDGSVTKHKL